MKKSTFSLILIIITILFSTKSSHAQIEAEGKAGLIITPTRVELDSRQRSASITIANNGKLAGSYKVDLVNKIMTEDGGIINAPEGSTSPEFADKMLRLSPRRVTIEAGGNQDIRILVRKPKDLPDGEYRTHLSVMIIPDDEEKSDTGSSEKDKINIAIKANYGVTIPILIENGTLSATGGMDNLKYHPANPEKKEPTKVTFNLTRDGNKSLYGDIKITYVDNGGKETVVKFMGGLALYTPNTLRKFEVNLDIPDGLKISGGKLIATYQQKEKDGGKLIAQSELKL